jgi:hypothetical protein
MAAKKAPAKKMAGKTADSSKLTPAQQKVLAASAKNRTDRYGSSGMGETKAGVTAKDMAKINKGRKPWEMLDAERTNARGTVMTAVSRYDSSTQRQMAAAAAKNRKDKYGLSGFGETKAGVTAKDMAKINKGRGKFDKKMPIEEMITPRGNVRGYMGVYDNPAKAKAAAAAKMKKKK